MSPPCSERRLDPLVAMAIVEKLGGRAATRPPRCRTRVENSDDVLAGQHKTTTTSVVKGESSSIQPREVMELKKVNQNLSDRAVDEGDPPAPGAE